MGRLTVVAQWGAAVPQINICRLELQARNHCQSGPGPSKLDMVTFAPGIASSHALAVLIGVLLGTR